MTNAPVVSGKEQANPCSGSSLLPMLGAGYLTSGMIGA